MPFYALIVLDKEGRILSLEPEGCQFNEEFLRNVVIQERENNTPHPNVYDMGGGFLFHTLWSGKEPFIIKKEYLVGIVSDSEEDNTRIKKALRKITNNVLIHIDDTPRSFKSYFNSLWNIIFSNQLEDIKSEKPKATRTQSSPQPSLHVTSAPDLTTSAQKDDEFQDLLELHLEDTPSTENDPFSSDPFGGSSSSDPFGGSPASDPFGGSSASDPFGGSSASDPFGTFSSTSDKREAPEEFFREVETVDPFDENPFDTGSKSETIDPFAENPWANTESQSFNDINEETEIDPFAENPWGDTSKENKNKTNKDIDPFDENPFG